MKQALIKQTRQAMRPRKTPRKTRLSPSLWPTMSRHVKRDTKMSRTEDNEIPLLNRHDEVKHGK